MRFSIVTPTMNALEHLKRCVGSVRGQESVTFEHHIVDSASSDGTPQWLSVQSDLVSSSERDRGMYDAINTGWSRSRGEILSWLNSDEQYLPGTLAFVSKAFESNPRVEVIWGDCIIVDLKGRPIALRREIPFRASYVKSGSLYLLSCTAFFRRSLFDRGLLNFDPHLRYAGDLDLFLSLAQAEVRFKHVSRYLSLFGNYGTNMSSHGEKIRHELARVRECHGPVRSRMLRKSLICCRVAERLLDGGYLRRRARYSYAVNEVPEYVNMSAQSVGSRFSVRSVQGEVVHSVAL